MRQSLVGEVVEDEVVDEEEEEVEKMEEQEEEMRRRARMKTRGIGTVSRTDEI